MARRGTTKALAGVVLCVLLAAAGCRGKPEKGSGGRPAPKEPVAEVKQSIETPVLAPPQAPEPEAAPSLAEPPAPQPPPQLPAAPESLSPPPQGPITLPPPPAAEAPSAAPAPPAVAAPAPEPITPLQPAPLAEGSSAPTAIAPAALPPAAPPAATAPSSTTAPPAEAVAALPAPAAPTPPEATPAPPQPTAYEPQLARGGTNILLILDASGSMAAPFGLSALSKLDVVRNALLASLSDMTAMQDQFPRNIGLRVFGAASPLDRGDKTDSQLVAKMGEPNLDLLKAALEGIAAQGLSPLAYAISKAAEDFPPGAADRMIVLVVDGADNADGNPCTATEGLEALAAKTTVHVVLFDVGPTDLLSLECVSKAGDGQTFLARNEAELRAALDQAINSTIPYNLKLAVQAAGGPIPFETVLTRAGSEEVLRREKSFGAKLLRLDPGSYDIRIDYADSAQRKIPSKILKGVEVLATTKLEQTVAFDLGELVLVAVGDDGLAAPARFRLSKAGSAEIDAQVEAGAEPKRLLLTPGEYDISADLLEIQFEGFELSEKGVAVAGGERAERAFRFQKGTLALKGITTQKEAIPFLYQILRAGTPEGLVAGGAFSAEGGSLQLAPGTYDLIVTGTDPKMSASPRTKVANVVISAAETTELTVAFEMGTLKLSAVDGKGNKLPAAFLVRNQESQAEMARAASVGGDPVLLPLPPGTYDIVASSLKSSLEPKPSVPLSGVVVTSDKPAEQVIKFILGTLRLRGSNAKEQPLATQFTIYRAGTEEVVAAAPVAPSWMVFDLAPGRYDALAMNISSEEKPPPMIWLRDLAVEDGRTTSHEAIFTAGKLKIIGRGPNNQIVPCSFKVFQYGKDRELINGMTGEDWEIFEIQPGKYYLESGYHDDVQSVLLKQWVNITVGENEVVEVVLRF